MKISLLTKQIYKRELEYNFKDYVVIDLTFGSDTTLYWKERKSGSDANEEITTIHLNDHTTLTGWVEHDKTIVSLFSDFSKGETYGFQYFNNGKIRKLIGTIKPKE
jgi:hypothetical protein